MSLVYISHAPSSHDRSQPGGTRTCPETFATPLFETSTCIGGDHCPTFFSPGSRGCSKMNSVIDLQVISPPQPQRTLTGSGRRGCCHCGPSPRLQWTKLEVHTNTAKLHFGVHLVLHHFDFVVPKLFDTVALQEALSNDLKQRQEVSIDMHVQQICFASILKIHAHSFNFY